MCNRRWRPRVKGVLYTNFTDDDLSNVPPEYRHLYNRIWDVTDYVVPPSENGAVFVTTNVIITPNQTRGTCPEDPDVAPCSKDLDCASSAAAKSHGVRTGICDLEAGSCQINAWCPVEKDVPPLKKRGLLEGSKNFTVLIKNQIEFPYYNQKRTNILESVNASYLEHCRYDNETDPFCPVFQLDDIVTLAGENYTEIAKIGCVISVSISWDCDLDYDFMKYCRPEYSFRRLDNPRAKIAPGWNFRHSDYYSDNLRTLYKAYGILFVIEVEGKAGKFNAIPTFLSLGAGFALLGLATVICDIIVLYCARDKLVYRDKKYLYVRGSDAYRSGGTSNPTYNDDDDQAEILESSPEPSNQWYILIFVIMCNIVFYSRRSFKYTIMFV